MTSSIFKTTAKTSLWRGSLQFRLTVLILLIIAPLGIAITAFVTTRASNLLEQNSISELRSTNQYLSNSVNLWLDANIRALRELAIQPDILSMDPSRQKPVLEAMASAYPHMYLVSITDLNGINTARNDNETPKDYSDRVWFQQPRTGAPLTFQTLIGRTTGQPALVVSTPVYNSVNQIVGVAMFATDLDALTSQVHASSVGKRGISYLLDANNQAIAHPNPDLTAELRDFSNELPIASLRAGKRDAQSEFAGLTISYTDNDGIQWRSTANQLENGWVVVVQIPEDELFANARVFRSVTWPVLGIIIILLLALSWLTIGRGIRPIRDLTETATAIATGDLSRTAAITSKDEVGTLASAFNSMTSQLRDLVTGLEGRVRERTVQLERRARQLQAAAEVGRAITSLGSLDELLTKTTLLIASQFGYYHAGIFLMDNQREYAVLSAANSSGGQRMLARGHRLKVGQTGIVGYVTQTGKARIALDVGQDAVFFDNPDLPETRSEMALPLVIGDEILGALDVQSIEPQAFSHDDITTLQVLADQLAVAIKNARLFEENRAALEATRRRYSELGQEAWVQLFKEEGQLGYLATAQRTIQRVKEPWEPDLAKSVDAGELALGKDGVTIGVPLKVRGQVVGALRLKKPEDSSEWTQDETSLALAFAEQLSSALESARLYRDAQQRAARESLVSDISARISTAPRLDTVLRETALELGQVIADASVTVKLISPSDSMVKVEDSGNGTGESPSIEDVGLREIQRIIIESKETGYTYLPEGKLVEAALLDDAATRQALASGDIVMLNDPSQVAAPMAAIPVQLRDQVIGIIHIQAKDPDRRWTENEIALVQTISERAATAIENASLLSESQRRAAKERTIGEISAKIGSLVDIDNIVQTAIQELSRTLPGADVAIQLQNK